MITVIAVMKAKKGTEQEMEQALRDVVKDVAGEEGTLAYVLNRAKKDPQKFLMYEKYRDKEALNHHGSTPHFAAMFQKIAPLLDGDPSIEIFEELTSIEGKR